MALGACGAFVFVVHFNVCSASGITFYLVLFLLSLIQIKTIVCLLGSAVAPPPPCQ